MALTMEAINKARDNNEEIRMQDRQSFGKLEVEIANLKQNPEFQKFMQGTPIGQDIFEKILRLMDQRARLTEESEKLYIKTSDFLSRQEMINRR